jgi:hypothetical protein
MNAPKIDFDLKKIRLPLEVILPVRKVKNPHKTIRRYETIVASIKEIGLIEPLMVFPQKNQTGLYLLMDGHLRYHVLKELGAKEADCIICHQDESFTFNARINRVSPIQEHQMIMKAIKNGVTPERLAAALNLKVGRIHDTMNLLTGIHAEAIEIIKDKQISQWSIRALKKVTPLRQIEMAELMVCANNFTQSYARSLLMATSADQLVSPAKPKKVKGLSVEEIARLEQEMQTAEHDFKAVEQSYGTNVLNLTLAAAYVKKLLLNAKVIKYLSSKYPEIFSVFEEVAAMESI